MYEGLDTVVLYEELAYEDVLPVAWKKLPEPFDPALIGSFADRNLRVLQALAEGELLCQAIHFARFHGCFSILEWVKAAGAAGAS